jgi:hypothetical protein|tara:strand:+ start:27 stop:425 length:399 start_codon:yes stop_codon:yes gene_type:complete
MATVAPKGAINIGRTTADWSIKNIPEGDVKMIIQNQIRCLKCKDEPYSNSKNDLKECDCGAVAVDGGMDYLRRIGNPEDYREMSVTIPDGVANACNRAINDTIRDTDGKTVGVMSVVVRVLRDNGVKLKEMK